MADAGGVVGEFIDVDEIRELGQFIVVVCIADVRCCLLRLKRYYREF